MVCSNSLGGCEINFATIAKTFILTIMKTFKQISDQCERIAKLYMKGFGTKKMYEKVEEIFFTAYMSMN